MAIFDASRFRCLRRLPSTESFYNGIDNKLINVTGGSHNFSCTLDLSVEVFSLLHTDIRFSMPGAG